MTPDQPDGMAPISAKVPTNHAEAIFQLAQHRSTRENQVTQSQIIREFIADGLRREAAASNVPGEVRDLLDDDLVANAGGDELDEDEEGNARRAVEA